MASGAAGRSTLGLMKPTAIEVPQVSFAAKEIDFAEWKGDLLAIAVSESDMSKDDDLKFLNSILKRLDGQLNGLLSDASIEEDFKGKNGQSMVLRHPGFGFRRLGLVGLSQSATSVAATYRDIGEAIAVVAKAAQASSAAIILASTNGISEEFKLTATSVISIGIVLGLHEGNRYNSGIIFARELVNLPANVLTPAVLAEEASKVASVYSGVFTAKQWLQHKDRASLLDRYNEFDMGGSAATFGAAKAIGQIKPSGVEVHFIVVACENMISGTGMRPGDIVTASNGKIIEVNNTDAEGRLTLADALHCRNLHSQ
ncbi:hypothetical protein M5K25_010009 [Dendrobium thyrsiflorum]|uniref:Cytosol aminopeptidase domain-containing protein n=1 Tax=Dendrobium thyrsiflorum TaxID=117978 RepID=A0ABD0V7B0_DENTH